MYRLTYGSCGRRKKNACMTSGALGPRMRRHDWTEEEREEMVWSWDRRTTADRLWTSDEAAPNTDERASQRFKVLMMLYEKDTVYLSWANFTSQHLKKYTLQR